MNVGERIQARRKQLGMTAEELANRIGKTRTTVSRYETGYIEKLPSSVLIPIAEALNTTPSYLMGWEEDDLPEGRAELIRTPEDQELLDAFHRLNEAQRKTVLALVKSM